MVVALLALSLAMIVGGIAAVVQGFPYVRLEQGVVMVAGGVTAASAGAVLLGLSAILYQLKRMTMIAGRSGSGSVMPVEAQATPRPSNAGLREPAFEVPPTIPAEPRPLAVPAELRPVNAEAASLAGIKLSEADMRPVAMPLQAVAADATPPAEPPPMAPTPDDNLFAPSDATPVGKSVDASSIFDELALRPALDDAPSEKKPAEEEAPAPPKASPDKEDEAQVVGTYASGGNTYVMFSNGKIEAETPRGRFTFDSLSELKAFVENGGESSARGAA